MKRLKKKKTGKVSATNALVPLGVYQWETNLFVMSAK